MEYRKDIDGLRALAVLPVIFFHAGFEIFNGGFLGVDVFFVISGFLITSILILELEQSKFSIVNFYERRARRIMPALFAMLFFTYCAGFVFMAPYEFKEFSQSLVSVIAFLSNIFFYLEIDYFSIAAEEMPLLHTWSLAIEEQYYIFFPPLLFLAWKFGSKKVLLILCILTILSFASVLILNGLNNLSASFYWPLSRAWELLLGSICALLVNRSQIKEKKYLSNIGLLVLTACLFIWSKDIAHPGYLTAVPVIATCLIILFPNKNSLSFKLLSNQKVVFVGLISYSLYLWHQPIFAFLRMKSIGHPSEMAIISAIIITFIAAYLSYKYIETPFRNKSKYSRKFIFSSSISVLTFFGFIGLFGHLDNGISSRFIYAKSYSESIKHSPKREVCHSSKDNYLSQINSCTYFEENISWATLGDSHVVEPTYALAKILKDQGEGLRHHSFSGCPPALNYQINDKELCSQWLNENLNYLIQDDKITNVLVAFRYSSAIYGDHKKEFPEVPKKIVMDVAGQHNFTDEEKLDLYWQSLEDIIVKLLDSGKKVWLMEPIPELPLHIDRIVTPFSIYGQNTLLDLTTSTSKEYYVQRNQFILEKLRTLNGRENLSLIKVYDLLCHEKGCPAVIDNSAIYFDDDHLSIEGSRILFERLTKEISL